MRTHVALLRGVNVGGNNKVPMAELRKLAVELGHGDVATYIQSGNLVFSTARTDADGLAAQLEREIAARLGVTTTVVVVSRAELAQVVADNPYPHEQDPKHLHAVFRQQPFDEAGRTGVAAALERAAKKGSRDEAAIVGKTLYLRTPDGLGRSELAAQLARVREAAGTARNWASVGKLLAMLDEA